MSRHDVGSSPSRTAIWAGRVHRVSMFVIAALAIMLAGYFARHLEVSFRWKPSTAGRVAPGGSAADGTRTRLQTP
jgi:hypothetical protein